MASDQKITSVLKETRVFDPPADFQSKAHIASLADYERMWQAAKEDPTTFWGEQARTQLEWFEPFSTVLAGSAPALPLVRRRKDQRQLQLP